MNEHDKRGLYKALECNPNSSAADLKRSYRKLALRHHPDREQDPSRRRAQHDRMRHLNEAYDTLRDPDRRSEYDEDCAFPRCALHPANYLSGICFRCSDPVCPECSTPIPNDSPADTNTSSVNGRDARGESPGKPTGNPSGKAPGQTGPTGARWLCRACLERSERRRRTQDPVERALLALEDGELDAAQQDLNRALLVNPRDVVALTALSTVREKRGDWKGAVMALRFAMQIKPGHAFSHYRLGNLFCKLGDLAQAREEFREALRLNPGSSKYRGAMSLLESGSPASPEPRFHPGDQVRHEVFGSGEVTEVTPVGVRVRFLDDSHRWLDPVRAPMARRLADAACG